MIILKGLLRSLRLKKLNGIVLAHLNINSMRNKPGLSPYGIAANVDVFMISETKFDDTFSWVQLFIVGYGPAYRLDWNCKEGCILLYIRDDILSKLIEINRFDECVFIELRAPAVRASFQSIFQLLLNV